MIRSPRARCCLGSGQLILLTLFLSVLCGTVAEVELVRADMKDVVWEWLPQLDLPVPPREMFEQGATSAEDNQRLLVKVGIPFIISLKDPGALASLLEVLLFMGHDGDGLCPRHESPFRVMYFRLFPEKLELLYGEARLSALDLLRPSAVWETAMSGTVGPHVREAEAYIANLTRLDPPGHVLLLLPFSLVHTVLKLPFSDMRVDTQKVDMGEGLEKVPQLLIDHDATSLRHLLQDRIQAKQKYAAHIRHYDEVVHQESEALLKQLEVLRQEEQKELSQLLRRKRHYRRFLAERSQRMLRRHDGTGREEDEVDLATVRYRKRQAALHAVVSSRSHFRDGETKEIPIQCRKILAAKQTLEKDGASSADPRARRLRQLFRKRGCDPGTAGRTTNARPPPDSTSSSLSTSSAAGSDAAAQSAWRTIVAHMISERKEMVLAPNFGQILAALRHLWELEKAQDVEIAGITPDGEERSTDFFDAALFFEFANRFVARGLYHVYGTPRFIRAELHYFIAMLSLLDASSNSNKSNETLISQRHRIDPARAVTLLYQSLWEGSTNAAAALATMREHGIYIRQHRSAAQALLLRSAADSSTSLYRQLLRNKLHRSSSPGQTPRIPVERLLRYEQFYATVNSWSEINAPFINRGPIHTAAMEDGSLDANSEQEVADNIYDEVLNQNTYVNSNQRLRTGIYSRMTKAYILMTGYKGVPRNPKAAACEMLSVLRQFGYFCDVNVTQYMGASSPNGRPSQVPSILYGKDVYELCPQNTLDFHDAVTDYKLPYLSCPFSEVGVASPGRQKYAIPISDELHTMLQKNLLQLSYLHLLYTQDAELSGLYAALSLQLSHDALKMKTSMLDGMRHPPHQISEESKINRAKQNLLYRWTIDKKVTSTAKVKTNVAHSFFNARNFTYPSLSASPFVDSEALLLLAISVLDNIRPSSSSRGSLDGDSRAPGETAMPLPRQKFLSGVLNLEEQAGARINFDIYTVFFITLTAVQRWGFEKANVLDRSLYSMHSTDAFVLAAALLLERDEDTGAPLLSIPHILEREIQFRPCLGFGGALLPNLWDSPESYASRLLLFASRKISTFNPLVEFHRSGLYAAALAKSTGASKRRLWQNFMDVPTESIKLAILRAARERSMEAPKLQTLLYAADYHLYVDSSRWTSIGAWMQKIWNWIIYLFARTTEETILQGLESSLRLSSLPSPGSKSDYVAATTTTATATEANPITGHEKSAPLLSATSETHASDFVDAVSTNTALRELLIAGQLLSLALDSGMPEGFSLMFLEVSDRNNRFLVPFVDHLALHVWQPQAPAVWKAHYLVAQWEIEKPRVLEQRLLFSLSGWIPFRYASTEGRQELFARVGQRTATVARRSAVPDDSAAVYALALCAGFLVSTALWNYNTLPLTAYEGSFFPAADAECVRELTNALLTLSPPALLVDNSTDPAITERDEIEQQGSALIQDLTERLSFFYELTMEPPARRLPYSEERFSPGATKLMESSPSVRLKDLKKLFRRRSTQFVEQWSRQSGEKNVDTFAYGEGYYYNSRLHRVTGYWWASTLRLFWLTMRTWLPW